LVFAVFFCNIFQFFPQCFGSQRGRAWWALLCFYQANSLWTVVLIIFLTLEISSVVDYYLSLYVHVWLELGSCIGSYIWRTISCC
jgi:hypothetical protein